MHLASEILTALVSSLLRAFFVILPVWQGDKEQLNTNWSSSRLRPVQELVPGIAEVPLNEREHHDQHTVTYVCRINSGAGRALAQK